MKIKQIAFYALILLVVEAVTSPVSASDPQCIKKRATKGSF